MIILVIQIIIAYIISVIIHEIAHSEVASYLKDNTAKKQGRSSLNPFKHFTLTGPKSVPLRLTSDRDYIIANAAGIVASILLALLALFLFSVKEFSFLKVLFWINLALVIVNIIPSYTLKNDGYKIWKHIFH